MSALLAIHAIARNTLREALRSRLLYTLVFFAVLLIGSSALLATLSYVERERILQDIGLSAIRLMGAIIAVFVGVGLIHREVERRTVYTILSKPVSRTAFVVGKFAGLVATLWLMVGIMGLAFAAVSLVAGAPLGWGHLAALGLTCVELALLVAVATLFSSFTTPTLASAFTLGVYLLGHLARDLRDLGAASDSHLAERVTAALYLVLPDLEAFDLVIPAVHGLTIPPGEALMATLYGFGYAALVLVLAAFVFERRDLR